MSWLWRGKVWTNSPSIFMFCLECVGCMYIESMSSRSRSRSGSKSPLPSTHKQDLISYVVDQKTSRQIVQSIRELCETQPPVSRTVYRGHLGDDEIRPSPWYSATSSHRVAKEQFSGKTCCVFKIHLVNVPVIDVNKHVGKYIGHYAEEDEYIFLGGGVFYKDNELRRQGFIETKAGEYECWYALSPKKVESSAAVPPSYKMDELLRFISEDDYVFIDILSDLDPFLPERITLADRKKLLTEILRRKTEMSGGRRKHRMSRRHSKRKILKSRTRR